MSTTKFACKVVCFFLEHKQFYTCKTNKSTHLSKLNISSLTMNPSLFKSYTEKAKAVFSSRLPFKNDDIPINHSSCLTRPSHELSNAQNIRSINISSVFTPNVLCNKSRNTTRSKPSLPYKKVI